MTHGEKNANGVNIASPNSIANIQSLRYRGYCYDTDTGFYYLQSRYYDPVTHRFINTDGYVSTGTGVLGYNMFLYCENNPINCSDSSGEKGYRADFIGPICPGDYWYYEDGHRVYQKPYKSSNNNVVDTLYEHTSFSYNSDYSSASVNIHLEEMSYKEIYTLSELSVEEQTKQLNQRIILKLIIDSHGKLIVSGNAEEQLWGEILLHAKGYINWDIDNCKVIDLDITYNNKSVIVDDPREYINIASAAIGTAYSHY